MESNQPLFGENHGKLLSMWEYARSDFIRYGRKPPTIFNILFTVLTGSNQPFCFTFWMRFCKHKSILYPLAFFMHRKYKHRHGLHIPPWTNIGYGFCISHGINIVINPTAVIGNNCYVSHMTTIGNNNGDAATIGDNVYICPNCNIVGNVHIGDNVTIGSGTVVIRDVPSNATVAGVPAEVKNYNNPARFVKNKVTVVLFEKNEREKSSGGTEGDTKEMCINKEQKGRNQN